MKKRTRMFAWIFAIGASLGAVRFCLMAIALVTKPPKVPSSGYLFAFVFLALAVSILLMIGWTNLLDRRIWAWRLLISISGMLGVMLGVGAVTASFLLKGHIAAYVALLALPAVLPLWVLLTDRPSGWSQSANPQPEIPDPQ